MLKDEGAINETTLNDYTRHPERGVLLPIVEVGKELQVFLHTCVCTRVLCHTVEYAAVMK